MGLHTRVSKSCRFCGNDFSVIPSVLARGSGIYCSRDCKRADKNVELQCKNCKATFTVTRYRAKFRSFCSKACARRVSDSISTQLTARPCLMCGTPVFRYPSQFKAGNGKYCSWSCKSRARMKHRVQVRCVLCGRKIERLPSQMPTLNFCDQRCAQTYLLHHPVRRKYTPDLLRSLKDVGGSICPYPGCSNPRVIARKRASRWNPWQLCRLHAFRVYSSLLSRKHKRNRLIMELM